MKNKKIKEFIFRCAFLTTIICFCLLWPTIFGILGAKDTITAYKIESPERHCVYSQEG